MRGGRYLSPRDFWTNTRFDFADRRSLVVHVLHSHESHVSVTFSAVDPPERVISVIGSCFDAVIESSLPHVPEARRAVWHQEAAGLDGRVHVQSPLTSLTDDTPVSVFGA